MPDRARGDFAAHLHAWRTRHGIPDPEPRPEPERSTLPPDLLERVQADLTRPLGPALLVLVVLGRVSAHDVHHVRHLSAELDQLYDDAYADALARHADTTALMRNDLAHAQIREVRRRRAA